MEIPELFLFFQEAPIESSKKQQEYRAERGHARFLGVMNTKPAACYHEPLSGHTRPPEGSLAG